MGADGRDWVVAEEAEDDDPTVYEMVEMRPLVIERRTYLNGRWIDDSAGGRRRAVDAGGGPMTRPAYGLDLSMTSRPRPRHRRGHLGRSGPHRQEARHRRVAAAIHRRLRHR